jgi:hypothetical protein
LSGKRNNKIEKKKKKKSKTEQWTLQNKNMLLDNEMNYTLRERISEF